MMSEILNGDPDSAAADAWGVVYISHDNQVTSMCVT